MAGGEPGCVQGCGGTWPLGRALLGTREMHSVLVVHPCLCTLPSVGLWSAVLQGKPGPGEHTTWPQGARGLRACLLRWPEPHLLGDGQTPHLLLPASSLSRGPPGGCVLEGGRISVKEQRGAEAGEGGAAPVLTCWHLHLGVTSELLAPRTLTRGVCTCRALHSNVSLWTTKIKWPHWGRFGPSAPAWAGAELLRASTFTLVISRAHLGPRLSVRRGGRPDG